MKKQVTANEQFSDGRPCSMDEFCARLWQSTDDPFERTMAIEHWLFGDWQSAMDYLEEGE